jgi:hypothetical protein
MFIQPAKYIQPWYSSLTRELNLLGFERGFGYFIMIIYVSAGLEK